MTLTRLLLTSAVIATVALPLGAQQAPAPRPPHAAPVTDVPANTTETGEVPAVTDPDAEEQPAAEEPDVPGPLTFGLAGPYLAARMAAIENNFSAAARYYSLAVAQDPSDRYLQDSALVALISAGEIDRAVSLVDKMQVDGEHTELSGLVQRARLSKAGQWADVLALLDKGEPSPSTAQGARLLDGMIKAWSQMGSGQATEALASFEALTKVSGASGMANYHLALARAIAGDFEGAETLLADEKTGAHILGFIAHAQVLAQLDRREEAAALLDAIPGVEAEPLLLNLRDKLRSKEPIPFDLVKTPQEGIAQVFLTFATALAQVPEPDPLALIHARLGAWIAPDLGEARLLVAQLLQMHQQFDLAEAEFKALGKLGQVRPVAELARIDALTRAERFAEAESAAKALTETYPDLAQVWIALGDVMRQQNKYTEAVPAYDQAITLLDDAEDEERWFPLYARGIALERSNQFDKAESDFLAALELRPDQPSLLNYLGYSWIDRNENLDRGLELINRAVELSPDDGYILDSLAWAYYRLGRYQEAVEPMERAVLSMASDPTVNDHLGDVYWMVGRKREAEVQWRRALSLNPGENDDVDPDRIRDKLERGLDAVLADEKSGVRSRRGAEPQNQAEVEATSTTNPVPEAAPKDQPVPPAP